MSKYIYLMLYLLKALKTTGKFLWENRTLLSTNVLMLQMTLLDKERVETLKSMFKAAMEEDKDAFNEGSVQG